VYEYICFLISFFQLINNSLKTQQISKMRYFENLNQRTRHKVTFTLLILLSLQMSFSLGGFIGDANNPEAIFSDGSKQISDINLLLPISTCTDCRKAIYNISAINGCYQW
jgi:hypothetical protein